MKKLSYYLVQAINVSLPRKLFSYFLPLVILFCSFSTNATNYYVSATSGNDTYKGTSENQAWKTLAKVNSFIPKPGDKILFKRGDAWEGILTPPWFGSSGSPITYGAYGTGEKPIIYGSKKITGWTKHSGNIYKAKFSLKVNQLFVNNKRSTLARYPNTDYFDVTSVSGTTKFSSSDLKSGINYKGATWIGRTSAFTMYSKYVTSSSAQTIVLESAPTYGIGAGEGFFLCDKLEFLDKSGEWYYDSSTKTVYLWTPKGDSPANYTVRGSVHDYGVKISAKNYINIENLNVLHSSIDGINVTNSDYVKINNNIITSPDLIGIHVPSGNSTYISVDGNSIYQANGSGVKIYSPNATISNNTIEDTGLLENINKSTLPKDNFGTGLFSRGNNPKISYNRIINSGYCGINWRGTNGDISYNFINGVCQVLDDGGGIYTYNGSNYNNIGAANSKVTSNIILNVHGNRNGYTKNFDAGYGIYMDNNTHDVLIEKNTIAYTSCGLYLHQNGAINVKNNTFFDAILLILNTDEVANSTITNNIIFTTARKGDMTWWQDTHQKTVFQGKATGIFDYNTYGSCHAIDNVFVNKRDFAHWKSDTKQDKNSKVLITPLAKGEKEELFYNDTKQSKSISLGTTIYKDINGKKVTGTFTLKPFTSRILINTKSEESSNQSPSINSQSFEIYGSKQTNESVGQVIASDSDQGQVLSYSIIQGNDGNLFSINQSTGEIFVKTTIPGTEDKTIKLVVKVLDNAANSLSASATITINLTKEEVVPETDNTPPSISSFNIPSTSESLTIPITTFSATDNKEVTGFIVTETSNTPIAGDTKWTTLAPVTYTFSQQGTHTLHAWVKDHAGNISGIKTASVAITLASSLPDEIEYVTICEGEEYFGLNKTGEYQRVISADQDSVSLKSVNFISNPDFTGGIENWRTWKADNGYNFKLSLDLKEFTSAPSSMRIDNNSNVTKTSGLHAIAGGKFEIEEGKEYVLTFNAKSTAGFSIGKLLILKETSPWTQYGTFSNERPVVTTQWNQVKVIFKATHTASDATFRMYLGNSLPAGHSLYVDDFHFAESSGQSANQQKQNITTHLTVNPVVYTTEDITILEGENYLNWTEAGEYERTLKSVSGCDSIVTTSLMITKVQGIIEDITICEGESYQDWTEEGQYVRNLKAISGADSIVTTNLWVNPVYSISESVTILEGENYFDWTEAGQYERVLKTELGCDSIVTTNLIVSPTTDEIEYVTICEGEEYFGLNKSGEYQRVISADQDSASLKSVNFISNPDFTAGIENWRTWKADNGYNFKLSLDLEEFTSAPSSMRIDCNSNVAKTSGLHAIAGGKFEIEEGKEYVLTFNAKSTAEFAIGKLLILKETSPWTQYGTFSNERPVVTTQWNQVKVIFKATHTASDATFRIYLGNSLPAGHSLYVDDFHFAESSGQAANQQEQNITTHLTVNPVVYTTEDITILEGEKYLNWSEAGEYERTLKSVSGCDSIVTTSLMVTKVQGTIEDITICEGESYQDWTEEGQYVRNLKAISGADSIVTTNLWVNPVYSISESVTILEGENYFDWTEAGQYERVLKTELGCDSIVTTNLIVSPTTDEIEYVTICEGEEYFGLNKSGEYQRVISADQDSVSLKSVNFISNPDFTAGIENWRTWKADKGYNFNLSLDLEEFTSAPSSMRIVNNSNVAKISGLHAIAGGKFEIEEGKEYVLTFNAKSTAEFAIGKLLILKETSPWTQYGTFSNERPVVTTQWNQVKVIFKATHTASDATFRIYLGNSLPAGHSLYVDDFHFAESSGQAANQQTQNITTHLTVNPVVYTTEDITILEGEKYLNWSEAGEYERTLKSVSGCDSIVTTSLMVTKVQGTIEDITICEGESYQDWTEEGQYVRNLKAISGADSIVTTNLWVNPVYSISESVTILEGENYFDWTESGEYERVLKSISGCDSIVTTILNVAKNHETVEDIYICEGDSYQNWTEEGQYVRNLKAISGADSIVTTNLWVSTVQNVTESVTILEGEKYFDWTKAGQYERVLKTKLGCDSIVTTNLIVLPTTDEIEYVTICEGEEYLGLNKSGVYQRVISADPNSVSLKSVNFIANYDFTAGIENWRTWKADKGYNFNLSLDLNEFTSAPSSMRIVNNSNVAKISSLHAIAGGKFEIEEGKEYELTFNAKSTAEFSIGSLIILKETSPWTQYGTFSNERPVVTTEWNQVKVIFKATHTASDATFRIYLGNSLPAGHSLYVDDFQFAEIGDQAANQQEKYITTYLTVNPLVYTKEDITILEGENYQNWTEAGEYERTLTTVSGCDSMVTTILYVAKNQHTTEDIYICEDESYQDWTEEGQYVRNLKAISGADSIVTTNLWINPVYNITESVTIFRGENYFNWTEPGLYKRVLKTTFGCDSIVTTQLQVIAEKSNDYFKPIWETENGSNHMNFNVVAAYNNGIQLEVGDEIAIFDGQFCVGAIQLSRSIDSNNVNSYVQIHASQDDGNGNGFIEGNMISFKIWDASEHVEYIAGNVIYKNDLPDWNTSGAFASGSTSVIAIGITSKKEEILTTQSIELTKGWNIFSSYLVPDNSNMAEVQNELRVNGQLIKVQDEVGNTYENWGKNNGWINNIGEIQKTQGYKIKVEADCTLEIVGQPIHLPLDINVKKGWNIISIPFDGSIDGMSFIQPLIEAGIFEKVQDEKGNSIEYWGETDGWINGIGNFIAGEGYKIQVSANGILPVNGVFEKSEFLIAENVKTTYFNVNYEGNGFDHMNINITELSDTELNIGDEIAAFDGDICVGAIKLTATHFSNGNVSINASVTEEDLKSGFTEGNLIELKIWSSQDNIEFDQQTEIIEGDMFFEKQASVFVKLSNQEAQDIQGLDSIEIDMYPNPASNQVTIRFSELPEIDTRIIFSDITGKQLIQRNVQSTLEVLDIESFPNGIYLINTVSGNNYKKVYKLIKR